MSDYENALNKHRATACKHCAGTATLTSQEHLITREGKELSPKTVVVKKCNTCKGTGYEI